jgi:S-adenosylmethionine hydrolase
MPRPVAFLSDYGSVDEFVGVCKAVMLARVPDLVIVDLTHEVPAHDVRAGGLALVRSVQYLPDEVVVLAVVDPGVGTDRRLVAVECEGATFVGPDNGLLAPAVAMLGGAREIYDLTGGAWRLPAPSATFAGRDVLAPAVAHLVRGGASSELGPPVDAASLVPGLVGLPRVGDGGAIEGEVWWIDRFGNCQLNIGPEELLEAGVALGGFLEVRLGARTKAARWVSTYATPRLPSWCSSWTPTASAPWPSTGDRPRASTSCEPAPPSCSSPRGSLDVDCRGAHAGEHNGPMRPGTTIAIAGLLTLILGAAFAQFVLHLGS